MALVCTCFLVVETGVALDLLGGCVGSSSRDLFMPVVGSTNIGVVSGL